MEEVLARDLEDFNFDATGSVTQKFGFQIYNSSATTLQYELEFIAEFRGIR